jgi:hypothetical protein
VVVSSVFAVIKDPLSSFSPQTANIDLIFTGPLPDVRSRSTTIFFRDITGITGSKLVMVTLISLSLVVGGRDDEGVGVDKGPVL